MPRQAARARLQASCSVHGRGAESGARRLTLALSWTGAKTVTITAVLRRTGGVRLKPRAIPPTRAKKDLYEQQP